MRAFFYTIWQIAWGFPQTFLGFLVFLAHARNPHFPFHGAIVTTWKSQKAVSLGLFVFIGGPIDAATPAQVDGQLLAHEYGHTIQSLILGPLYLLVIGLPSVLWLNLPACRRRRQRTGTSYYAFYTERLANRLAERFPGYPGSPTRTKRL